MSIVSCEALVIDLCKIIENYHLRQASLFSYPAGVYPAGNHLGDTGERDPCVTYGGQFDTQLINLINSVKNSLNECGQTLEKTDSAAARKLQIK